MGYGKKDGANIDPEELREYRRVGGFFLGLDEDALDVVLAR